MDPDPHMLSRELEGRSRLLVKQMTDADMERVDMLRVLRGIVHEMRDVFHDRDEVTSADALFKIAAIIDEEML